MTDAAQAAAVVPAGAAAAPAVRLLSREASILAFNRRVLAQARRPDVPLLERLRYVTIVSSNLDEFFEIRVADTLALQREPGSGVAAADVEAMVLAAHALVDEQYALLNDEILLGLNLF